MFNSIKEEMIGKNIYYACTCKNLDWDILELLLVWVDKKNSMEFLLNFLYYLYNYYIVCALSSHSSHVT